MATLKVWTDFSKRKNSTKQPTGGIDVDVKLKENTSIENPVFICNNLGNANYCQYAGNYYFINDIVFVTNSIVELHCSMDALATNKSAIVGSNQYVLYYSHNNTEITDSRLSTKTTSTTSKTTSAITLFDGESVVVAISGTNGVGYYALSPSDATNLTTRYDEWYEETFTDEALHTDELDEIINDPTDPDAQARAIDAKNRLIANKKSGVNASVVFQNILSAHWLPINPSGGDSKSIYIAQYSSEKNGVLITSPNIKQQGTIGIPWQATDWRKNAPYHQIYLNCPYFGTIPISPSSVIDQNSISWELGVHLLSGDAVLILHSGDVPLGNYTCNISSPYAIGSSNVNRASAGLTQMQMTYNTIAGVTGGASALMDSNITGTLESLANMAMSNTQSKYQLANDLTPQPSIIGGIGGSALKDLPSANIIECVTVFHDTTVEPNTLSATRGTPYNGVMAIPSSGYVQTSGCNIDSIAYGSEKDVINAMLDSGIYIE